MTTLTKRQEMVLRLLANGMNNHDIAFIMQIDERKVPGLITTVMEKCGLSSRAQCYEYLKKWEVTL